MNGRLVARNEVAELQRLQKQLCALRSRALDEYDIGLQGKVCLPEFFY